MLQPSHLTPVRRAAVILPLLVVSLGVLIGILALDLDGGRLMDERRRAQAAADAAALAAASNLYSNYWTNFGVEVGSSATNAAVNAANSNGYESGSVTVNMPPLSGAFAGKKSYVEVIIEKKIDASFGRIFTQSPLTVKARAVAVGKPMELGIIAMRAVGADTFVNEALALTVVGTPIIANSSDSNAYHQKGAGIVIASRFDITGGYTNPGGALILGRIRTGQRPAPDPLAWLPIPDSSSASLRSNSPLTINPIVPLPVVLQPGVYRGGIKIEGLAIVTMLPGTYIMEGGGFKVSGAATVAGIGVTVYNTIGTTTAAGITIDTLGKVVLTAPLASTYQGISFFQNRALTESVSIKGVGLTTITGVIYARSAAVDLNGLASIGADILGGAYVADTMSVRGLGGINIDLGLNPPRIPDVRLVE